MYFEKMTGGYSITPDVFSYVEVPGKGMISKTLHNDDHTKIVLFGFAPGHELAAHSAPMPATIQILKGDSTLTIGADVVEAQAGCIVHMQPHLTHAVAARTPLLMLLTLFKSAG